MSNRWSVKCVDCDLVVRLNCNYGEEEIAGMLAQANKLAAVGDLLPGLSVDFDYFDLRPEMGEGMKYSFFSMHRGHKLVAWSEYGYAYGDCAKTFGCPACHSAKRCNLREGHEGPCELVTDTYTVKQRV